MNKHTIFISDLHLESGKPSVIEAFFTFLQQLDSNVDAIYILGDLFKFWLGDDDNSNFNSEIKTRLKETSKIIPIYLMVGNRDFLLGPSFASDSGCTLITDPYVMDLYGKKTLLTHGDLLATNNLRYYLFRKLLRIPMITTIFLGLPLKIRLIIAEQLQRHSARKQKILANPGHLKPRKAALQKLLQQFNFSQVIYGHVHVATQGTVEVHGKNIGYISLEEWQTGDSSLCYYSSADLL